MLPLLLTISLAFGLDPSKLPTHRLAADDGGRITADGPITLAIVGNTRGRDVTEGILADIRQTSAASAAGVALLGDTVEASTAGAWKSFAERHAVLLEGDLPGEAPRLAGLPVVGDHEARRDARYQGWNGVWPGVGAAIGYNRVGSWYHFDLVSGDATWRVLMLDSAKERLGSRWGEQLAWLKRVITDGTYTGLIVMMHDPVFDLAGPDVEMNVGGGPLELIAAIEDEVDLLKIRLVLAAGHHASQALTPDGPFGVLHVGAGGGGASAELLRRWGPADTAGRDADVQLEPLFDLSLLGALDKWNRDHDVPEVVVDQAKARGSFEGFTGAYDPRGFPTHGWWQLMVSGEVLRLYFRLRLPDGSFQTIYGQTFTAEKGWKAQQF